MSEQSPHSTGVLYEIRWSEICPWLILVKALRVTLLVRVLILAMIGVWLTQWGWSAIDQLFSLDHPAVGELTDYPEIFIHPAAQSNSPLLRGWFWLSEPLLKLVDHELSMNLTIALLLYGLWAIVVGGIFGGAISRIAALYLTRGETIGPMMALRDAGTAWLGTTGAPLIAMLAALALAVPLILVGFLLRLDLFAIVAGLLWCVVLAWGLMLAIVLLGLLVGWPLMWACLGVERSDAFDGVSRCYAYVYQKPLQLAFYVLVASVLAMLGEIVVEVFASGAVTLSEWTVSWGAGSERVANLLTADGQTASASSRAIFGWKSTLTSLTDAFPMACLWSYAVGIYLLLRSHVDATEMDEVTLSDGTQQKGLPDLSAKETTELEANSKVNNA